MKGNYFKWFNSDEVFDQNLLCSSKNNEIKIYNKKCGAISKSKNCVDSIRCDRNQLVVCERDCSQFDCLKAKSKCLNF